MATLIAPGTSVTVQNDSFYVPATAPTVPLFFVATKEDKYQQDGVTLAPGTRETGVIRTVTGINESLSLYGVPSFNVVDGDEALPVGQRRQLHGDCRNEYGLFALNQFLEVGSRAYVVRADVDLTDVPADRLVAGPVTFTGTGSETLGEITVYQDAASDGDTVSITVDGTGTWTIVYNGVTLPDTLTPGNLSFDNGVIAFEIIDPGASAVDGDSFEFSIETATGTEIIEESGLPVFAGTGNGTISDSLGNEGVDVNQITAEEEVWTITATSPTAFTVSGSVSGDQADATVNQYYNNGIVSFTINSGSVPFQAGDVFTITLVSQFSTDPSVGPLGTNDASKRATIVSQLASAINSNEEVRSEFYEYNLILCPGYYELADELAALNASIEEEAFVIADTPMDLSPSEVVTWAKTTDRVNNNYLAYYYPHCLKSNIDGANVLGAASGAAVRTFAYSDNISQIWFSPAGATRGLLTGVSKVGYVSGQLGTATTFVETNLNKGQREALSEFGTQINALAFFPGRGLMIFDHKTSAPTASALDRVPTARLVSYIKRSIRKLNFSFNFEVNDDITRNNIKSRIEGFLNDIMIKRGLYDYVVVCDLSNNTPERIGRNELWVDVGIKTVKYADFIYVPLRLVGTGDSL